MPADGRARVQSMCPARTSRDTGKLSAGPSGIQATARKKWKPNTAETAWSVEKQWRVRFSDGGGGGGGAGCVSGLGLQSSASSSLPPSPLPPPHASPYIPPSMPPSMPLLHPSQAQQCKVQRKHCVDWKLLLWRTYFDWTICFDQQPMESQKHQGAPSYHLELQEKQRKRMLKTGHKQPWTCTSSRMLAGWGKDGEILNLGTRNGCASVLHEWPRPCVCEQAQTEGQQ